MTRVPHHTTKFALLGIDATIAGVAAAARRAGHTVAVACDIPADVSYQTALAGVPRVSAARSLVDRREFDAVLVGAEGWNDERAEAVRLLVQAGQVLLLSQPLSLSMLWAYELDMIRVDSGARLVPCLPDRLHPFIARLKADIEAACGGGHALGALEAIHGDRRMHDRSRDAVLRQLARDADLIRVLVGEPQRLSTLGGAGEAAWATLNVGFSGSRQLPVRWQVARGGEPGLTLTLGHAAGSTTVVIPDDDGPWNWNEERMPFDRSQELLDQVLAAAHGEPPPSREGRLPAATWADAARAIELAETVPRSLAKGRAIDLHQEEFSEIGTFKGTMASLGCGLVLAALAVLLVAAIVGGVSHEAGWGLGEKIAAAWPFVVLTVLAGFLALQILPLLVGAGRRP
jgi:hypothetical protein